MTTQMSEWTTEDHLNAYQVAGLLGMDPEWFQENWRTVKGVRAPKRTGCWNPDEVRKIIASVPPGEHTEFDNWAEDELLTYKQCGALHNPPIKYDSFAGYVRRAAKREQQGLDISNLPPQPEIIKLGHPLFAPDKIGNYLRNRPGPGYFKSGSERTSGYKGGRKAGTIPKRVRRRVPAAAGAE